MNYSDGESWWIILTKEVVKKFEKCFFILRCDVNNWSVFHLYVNRYHKCNYFYRRLQCITQYLNCFHISCLEFEYFYLLKFLVCYLFTCLWEFSSADHIFYQNCLYLLLICWWILCDWSSSQLASLHHCRLSLTTWPCIFFCLWTPPYLIHCCDNI